MPLFIGRSPGGISTIPEEDTNMVISRGDLHICFITSLFIAKDGYERTS